ncbi:MAG: DNA topoisomerase IV subunit B, partial [Candidatus Colwellbacteria bacterium]|nr:DNA topoisomerase IV subunit B [Candidatus Colwellbacteria bacterium]
VNALSEYMRVEVCRDGGRYTQEYKRGEPTTKVKKNGSSHSSGTAVTFAPDPNIFTTVEFDRKRILDYLRVQAFLTKGVYITFIDARADVPFLFSFYFEGGVKAFVEYLNSNGDAFIQDEIFYARKEGDGMEVELALGYTESFETQEYSFANNIYTLDGGMHLTGFRSALTRSLNDYARENGFLKEKDENLTANDVREGMIAAISVKLREPQFEGQTKNKLGNPEARTVVEAIANEALKEFLEKHPADARRVVEKCLLAAKARKAAKAAKDTVLRKGVLEGLTLPGKLADCQTRKADEAELFIVEGDSAGGSAKQGRDRRFQAILPLRGKILNVEKAHVHKMLSNNEIKSLIVALGTAVADEFDLSRLRYGKVVIMTDADVDGAHIRTLLLTLFYRHFLQVIQNGNLYIAQPPLYQIQHGKNAAYAYSEEEKDRLVRDIKGSPAISRYKGLGEMNPEQLWETTMDPRVRILKQVTVSDAKEADHLFDILMGGDVAPRKRFIQVHASSTRDLDI